MVTTDTTYIILFSANLAFIVTHLYGWLLNGSINLRLTASISTSCSPRRSLWVSSTCCNCSNCPTRSI